MAPRTARRNPAVGAAWALAAALPLIGLASLLLRSKLDPHFDNHRVHFVLFLSVAAVVYVLASAAGEAARRRGDARVLLIAMAFLATGVFLGLHALGTPGILIGRDLAGFTVAIPVGLLVASVFAVASAVVDTRPRLAAYTISHRRVLQGSVLAATAVWCVITIAQLPPLRHSDSEGARGSLLAVLAFAGAAMYGFAALRYYRLFRHGGGLLPASVIACFVLLAEAMIGVAVTGEREWHASWWEWHGLIVLSFVIVGLAARREWRDERFRALYLPSTRERQGELSVLFSDLAGFSTYAERTSGLEVATMLTAYFELATPLITRHGGEVEHFLGDGLMATFGGSGDHALRAARAGLELQREMAVARRGHPEWPPLRVGVNTGEAIVRQMGGRGHVAYTAVGDSVNVGARLEANAPVGGVLIGGETRRRLPAGAEVEAVGELRVKGREGAVSAFVLKSLP
jgi:class 3 adenylate cyclase